MPVPGAVKPLSVPSAAAVKQRQARRMAGRDEGQCEAGIVRGGWVIGHSPKDRFAAQRVGTNEPDLRRLEYQLILVS